jgi:Putative prokaryotic signal transducing protein
MTFPDPEDELDFRELVTIRKFRDLPEALLAQGRLESSGIQAFLFDDNMVRMDWLISNMLGGVKLKVEEANVEIAEEILSQEITEDFDTTEPDDESDKPRILPFRRRWE